MLRKAIRTATVYIPGFDDEAIRRAVNRVLQRPFEREFKALAELRDFELCLDVGANRGQSIEALTICAKGTRIISFEPQPGLADALRVRYPHVRVEACGLGERDELLTLHVPRYRHRCFDTMAALDPDDARIWFAHAVFGFNPQHLKVEEVKCRIRPLDAFGLAPDFVKLDVQGHELAVLKGARETLRCQPVLMVETPSPEVIAFLSALGYRMYCYEPGAGLLATDQPRYLNTLFMV
jgi:FkbM family methyltransferase